MADYKGIPFNGGMDSPSGSGAQHIVETLKAIIDFLEGCVTPGVLADAAGHPVLKWANRVTQNQAGVVTLDWENAALYTYTDASLTLDWGNRHTVDAAGRVSIDWENRTLRDAASSTTLLTWTNGIVLTNLPTVDPAVTGQVWNNAGVLNVSM